ncbi:protein similar isoform X2 [Sitodiplosis mosellana]|uniref:protein similar isoform X2 n=1 Tax=Sitodiplosis mosellana TaxID=263140 RepID=UPI0024446335|nr:protein similar isoform X2 [Sitodiplosis mosellana]
MDYYRQSSAATVPTGCSPTWYEAVNSEFFNEQDQIQKMKSNNQHIYANSTAAATTATNHSINMHEQPLTNAVTTTEHQQTHNNNNMEYYNRPISMHFNNDANNYFPPPPPPPSSLVGDGNALLSYAPCQGPRPWNFAQCYGFYGQPACSMLKIIDMEDFMNNEKRKEKSRDAARCRRSRETEIFTELGDTLPVRKDELENLDKSSVMRLAIATLKIEDTLQLFKFDDEAKQTTDDQQLSNIDENVVMKALDGFLIILSTDGDVIYVSENIHEYIGIQQIEIIGNPIWDYTHQCDHTELRDTLKAHVEDQKKNGESSHRNVLIRIKCTLTSRGRSVNIKSATYKVINIEGHIVLDETKNQHQFVAIARLIPHPSNIEVPLDSRTFLSKHSLNMKFSYVDDKMLPILGYKPSDLLDKSLYECHHSVDSEALMVAFKNVINKGQTETSRYRFLGRNGGYCWVVTQATLVYDKQKPQSVVCVNYVISDLINKNEVYSLRQLEAFNALSPSDKLKLQTKAAECSAELPKILKQETFEVTNNIKLEVIDDHSLSVNKHEHPNHQLNSAKIVDELLVVPEPPIRRVLIANQLNGTNVVKANPKAVTASVFKTIPIAPKQPFKAIGGGEHQLNIINNSGNNAIARAPQTVTASLIQPIVAAKRDSFGKIQSTIAKPSLVPRQTVVTASLFQPRNAPTVGPISSKFPSPTVNPQASRAAETMNKSFCMLSDDLSQPTLLETKPDDTALLIGVPSSPISIASSSPSMTPNSINNCSGETTTNNKYATNNLNDITPLDDTTTPLFGEIFDELILPDGYCTLLSDDINPIDSQSSKMKFIDPFINYRDEMCETSETSPSILSPDNLSKSPEGSSSLPSLCSPNSMSHSDEFAFMSTSLDNTDIDLSMRAPYIPMNENDDLPLLTEDLMWSAFSDELRLHIDIKEPSALQQQPLHLQLTSLPSQQFGPDPVEQMIIDGAINGSVKETPSITEQRLMFGTASNLASYLASKYVENDSTNEDGCNKSNVLPEILKMEQTTPKYECGSNSSSNSNTAIDDKTQQILAKNLNDDSIRSLTPTQIAGDPSKMEVIDSITDGCITTYTIQMFDNEAFTKNGTNATTLPSWTMNDLLQMNGNDTKVNAVYSAIPSPTKRTSSRSRTQQQQMAETTNVTQMNHKRPSPLDSSINKRLKSNSTNQDTVVQQQQQKSPHLLQHLMAPSPDRVRKYTGPANKSTSDKSNNDAQWNCNIGYDEPKIQSSDSVLKNLLCNMTSEADNPVSTIDQLKENNPRLNMGRVNMEFAPNICENDQNGMDAENYGLVDDIFLVNELNSSFPNSGGDASPFSSSDNDLVGLMKSAIDERKPFESFEKQITITVPQPPPLKEDAFSIGGGLFDGITDHTNILPASLISPMGTENSSYDYNIFDRTDVGADSLLDVWVDEMK